MRHKLAFFIEGEDGPGEADGRPHRRTAAHVVRRSRHRRLTQTAIFNFLVGSTDYSILSPPQCVPRPDEGQEAAYGGLRLRRHGLVNPPYALPRQGLPLIRSRTACTAGRAGRPNSSSRSWRLSEKKDEIYRLYVDQAGAGQVLARRKARRTSRSSSTSSTTRVATSVSCVDPATRACGSERAHHGTSCASRESRAARRS